MSNSVIAYSVGPDRLEDYDTNKIPQRVEWIVYWYHIGSYCGDGWAVYKAKDEDKFGFTDLSHCSCYGPTSDQRWEFNLQSTQELLEWFTTHPELLQPRNKYDSDWQAVRAIGHKVLDILSL